MPEVSLADVAERQTTRAAVHWHATVDGGMGGGAGGRTFIWRWVSRLRRAHLERLRAGQTSPYVRFRHIDCVQTIKMQTQRFVWHLVPSTFTLPVPSQTACHRMQANTALQTSASRQRGSAVHLALADHWASSTPYWHHHDCRRETRAQARRIARPVHCASKTCQCSPTRLLQLSLSRKVKWHQIS